MRWLFLGSSRHLNLALFLSVDRVATYLRERPLSEKSDSAEVVEFHEAIFEFSVVFHLMHTDAHHAAGLDSDCRPRMDGDWVVSHEKFFRANIILWGMHRDISTLEVWTKLVDSGLASFVREKVAWEGDHLRLVLTASDSKHITKE